MVSCLPEEPLNSPECPSSKPSFHLVHCTPMAKRPACCTIGLSHSINRSPSPQVLCLPVTRYRFPVLYK